jgi:hypothetical protein
MRQRSGRWLASLLVAAAAVLAVGGTSPAGAKEGPVQPVRDRYEPGEVATFVGYTSRSAESGWVEDGPFYAYLQAGETVLPLGEISVEPTAGLPEGTPVVRVQARFTVPPQLEPGHFALFFCNDPCVRSIGALAGATLNVGVDPVQPIVRNWPPGEPELANAPLAPQVAPATTAPPPTTVAPPVRTVPVAVEVRPSPVQANEAPTRDGRGVNAAPLAAGVAIALVCVGLVLAALRDS